VEIDSAKTTDAWKPWLQSAPSSDDVQRPAVEENHDSRGPAAGVDHRDDCLFDPPTGAGARRIPLTRSRAVRALLAWSRSGATRLRTSGARTTSFAVAATIGLVPNNVAVRLQRFTGGPQCAPCVERHPTVRDGFLHQRLTLCLREKRARTPQTVGRGSFGAISADAGGARSRRTHRHGPPPGWRGSRRED